MPLLEAHRYLVGDTELAESPFMWHFDDHAGVSFNTITTIFYLEKNQSENVSGGNLKFKFKKDSLITKPTKFDITTSHDGTSQYDEFCIPIESNMIIIMRGDVEHQPTDLIYKAGATGVADTKLNNYCRDSIVLQLPDPTRPPKDGYFD